LTAGVFVLAVLLRWRLVTNVLPRFYFQINRQCNSSQFSRFLILATNRGDNFHGGQYNSIFVFTTGS
jgi:hypothetical protein